MKKISIVLFFLVWFSGFGFGETNNSVNFAEVASNFNSNNILSSDIFIKTKVNIKDGIARKAKIYLSPSKIWDKHIRQGNYQSHYIKNIVAKVGDKKILDAHFGEFQYLRAYEIRFGFRDFHPFYKNIDYTLIDNLGNIAQKTFPIKRRDIVPKESIVVATNHEENVTIDPKVWSITSIDKVVKILYGETLFRKFIDNYNVKITRYDPQNNWKFSQEKCIHHPYSPMQFTFESKRELNSIAFFYTGYTTPLLAVFNIPTMSMPYVSFRLFLPKSGKIIIVAKSRDGKLYQSEPYFIDTEVIKSGSLDNSTNILFTLE